MAVVQRIYAEALLAAARENDRLDQVREHFDDFVAAVEGSDELRGFLRNPQIEPLTKRRALEDLLAGGEERFVNFVRLLAEKDRIAEVEAIHEEFERLVAAEERVLELDLTTAVELSDDEAERIVRRLEEATGRRIEATRRVEPDLIGGVVVQAGSLRLDASVRGRLDQLREELIATA